MADKIRELIRSCNVGEYSFDILVNRNIVLEAFKKHPALWKVLMEQSKKGKRNVEDLEDLETILEILDLNDTVAEEIPAFVADILQDMIKAAGSDVDAKEFLDYCVENEVDDIVNEEIYQFALLGFIEGRSEKKPKVNVSFK